MSTALTAADGCRGNCRSSQPAALPGRSRPQLACRPAGASGPLNRAALGLLGSALGSALPPKTMQPDDLRVFCPENITIEKINQLRPAGRGWQRVHLLLRRALRAGLGAGPERSAGLELSLGNGLAT